MSNQILTLDAVERRSKILELRKAGVSPSAIARTLDISKQQVNKDLREILAELADGMIRNAESVRALELERLDEMLRSVWRNVRDGDVASIATALKISERRAKLIGLDAPARTEVTGANGAAISITSDLDVTKLSDVELYQLGTLLEKTLPRLDSPGPTPDRDQERAATQVVDVTPRTVG